MEKAKSGVAWPAHNSSNTIPRSAAETAARGVADKKGDWSGVKQCVISLKHLCFALRFLEFYGVHIMLFGTSSPSVIAFRKLQAASS